MEFSEGVETALSDEPSASCGTPASPLLSAGSIDVSMPGLMSLGSVPWDGGSAWEQAVKLPRIIRAARIARTFLNFLFISLVLLIFLRLPFAPSRTVAARQLCKRGLLIETIHAAAAHIRVRIRHWNTSI